MVREQQIHELEFKRDELCDAIRTIKMEEPWTEENEQLVNDTIALIHQIDELLAELYK